MRSAAEMNPETAAGSPSESDHKEYMERPAGPEAALVLYVSQNPESEAFHTIRDAIRHAEEHSGHPIVIQIAPGIYREHLVIRTKGLTLRGETRENVEASCIPDEGKEKEAAASSLRNEVRITGSLGGYEILEDGIKRGTFRTQTVLITADDVTLENLTIENAAGPGHLAGQAIALHAYADRLRFYRVRLLGQQDTLFTGPLPEKEVEPGGFRGPTESFERRLCRMYFQECYVEGNIDFIFGGACAWFENCEIFCRDPHYPEQKRLPIAYVTAASTPAGQAFGYVFNCCLLTSDCPPESCFLGRPWREDAKAVFLRCRIGGHICVYLFPNGASAVVAGVSCLRDLHFRDPHGCPVADTSHRQHGLSDAAALHIPSEVMRETVIAASGTPVRGVGHKKVVPPVQLLVKFRQRRVLGCPAHALHLHAGGSKPGSADQH